MDIEQQLRAALAPCKPGPQMRSAVMACVSAARGSRRGLGRPILFGTILAMVAAAAMLAAYLSGSRSQVGVAAVASQIAPATEPRVTPPIESRTHVVANVAAIDDSPPHTVADSPVALPLRTVLLRPLQIESENPEVQAALREYYATIIDGLRAVPGLVLLQPDQAGESSEPRADFRLTLVGSADDGSVVVGTGLNEKGEIATQTRRQPASRPPRNWQMNIALEGPRAKPARGSTGTAADGIATMVAADHPEAASQKIWQTGEYKFISVTYTDGRLASGCSDIAIRQNGMCRSPAALAALVFEHLRLEILPADLQFRHSLQARVLDAGQSYEARFNALELLAREGGDSDLNPEIVRAAFDLVASSPDPYSRGRVLDMLRGHGQPTLLRSLIDMSSLGSDASLRMQALSILIADYKADPAARAALESLAANDPLPLARQVAERALSGDGAWNEYVIATVKDTRLTPAERFAPLAYLVQTNQKADARKLLDDQVIATLVEVLPSLVDDPSPAGTSYAVQLLATLGSSDGPAVIDLMLASLDKARTSRLFIVQGLQQFRDDPRVRSKLEEIAAGDQDSRVRDAAATPQSPTR